MDDLRIRAVRQELRGSRVPILRDRVPATDLHMPNKAIALHLRGEDHTLHVLHSAARRDQADPEVSADLERLDPQLLQSQWDR